MGLAKAGQGRDLLRGDFDQVIALQRKFHCPGNTLSHVFEQLFPQMQVGGARRYGLAAAYSVVIFVLVGAFALFAMRRARKKGES